jgi:hypothetical protein
MTSKFINYANSAKKRKGSGKHIGCCDWIISQMQNGPMQSKTLAESTSIYNLRQIQQALNVLSCKTRLIATNGKSPATYTLICQLQNARVGAPVMTREFRPLVRKPCDAMELAMMVRR